MSDKAPALTHQSIGELEQGAIGHAINKLLAELMADCRNRPGLEKARTLTITVKVTPKSNDSLDLGGGGLAGVAVSASAKHSVPPQSGGVEILSVRDGANLNGEPITEAVFTMQPLLRPGSN